MKLLIIFGYPPPITDPNLRLFAILFSIIATIAIAVMKYKSQSNRDL
jgi:hypothetical protein